MKTAIAVHMFFNMIHTNARYYKTIINIKVGMYFMTGGREGGKEEWKEK